MLHLLKIINKMISLDNLKTKRVITQVAMMICLHLGEEMKGFKVTALGSLDSNWVLTLIKRRI